MEEIWKDVVGYEGLYQVSNLGRVRSVDKIILRKDKKQQHFKSKIIKGNPNKFGYLLVCLRKNNTNKYFQVHRLVAIAFIPNPNNYPCVNHKDETKTNNNTENLEWCTYKYNANYGTSRLRAIETRRKKYKIEDIIAKGKKTKKEKGIWNADKPVNQFTWDGKFIKRFDSAEQVKKELGIHSVGLCARGHHRHAGGFIWLYDDDVDKIKERILNEKPTREILQYDKKGKFIRKWNSPIEIHKELGIKLTALSNCLHGRASSSGGYIWKYNK